jgi:hypothetical protein
MEKSEDIYWQRWQKLIEAAVNFQELLNGSVMIGGSAVALHHKHRYSFDADHILSDLKENYEEVLDFLEGRDDWETARINPPKLILGNFQGVETGVRQLIRNRPLETEQIHIKGKSLTIPTLPEMIRTKGWMVISRNATRDYIDFAAIAKHMGIKEATEVLTDINDFYSDLIRGSQASPIVQLIRQLAEPKPGDLDQIDLSLYKGIQPPYDSWDFFVKICEEISVQLGDKV